MESEKKLLLRVYKNLNQLLKKMERLQQEIAAKSLMEQV
jgi:hypothetical protein